MTGQIAWYAEGEKRMLESVRREMFCTEPAVSNVRRKENRDIIMEKLEEVLMNVVRNTRWTTTH